MKQLPTHLLTRCHKISCFFFLTASLSNQDQTNKENLALAGIDVSLSLNKAMICIPAPGQQIEDGTIDTNDLDKMTHSANVNSKCPKDSNKGGENKSVYLLHL